jgi:hypothetical protein
MPKKIIQIVQEVLIDDENILLFLAFMDNRWA